MKKLMIVLSSVAGIAATGAANAQSSLTLAGVVDVNLAHGSGSIANRTFVGNSGLGASQLRFLGIEDLGGGVRAGFWLDSQLNPDNGTAGSTNTNNQASGGALAGIAGSQGITFNRRSTVSVGGSWVSVQSAHLEEARISRWVD